MPTTYKVLSKPYLASLGIMSLSYEKAKKFSDELIKKGELTKEKQQKFITNLLEEARKNTSEISKILSEKIQYLAKKGELLKEKQDIIIKDLQVKTKATGVITEEKIKEVVKEVMIKSKAISKKSQKLIEDIKQKASKSEEERVKEILINLDIPTKEDLIEINAKLDQLTNKFESKRIQD